MNKLFKHTINIVMISILIFAMNLVVFAQGTTTISVSKSSASVGDSITVSVTASETGTVTVKYTSSMLSFSSCTASGYTSEGNSVSFSGKTGDIVFSAVAEGTASIIVSSSSCSGSSTTLTIGAGSTTSSTATAESTTTESTTTESTEETEVEEETVEETTEDTVVDSQASEESTTTSSSSVVGTLNSDGGFDIDGVAYVVSERYADSEMPSGFSKTTITIGSSTYSEPTNGTITLLYLKPADNTSGSGVFYLYDEAAGTVSDFVLLGDSDNYVIVKSTSEAPGTGFSQTVISVDGSDITAYTIDGSEFFYVYGENQDQLEGWFVYDQTYGTVSRADTSVFSVSASDAEDDTDTEESETDSTSNNVYVEKLSLYRKIIMGLIILCVILLFITINRIIKNHDDDDDVFDGDVFAKAPVRTSSRKLPRSIVFNNPDEDEDDYEDDDEYDDEYYDEDDYSTSEGTYEERRDASLNMIDLNNL